MIKQLIFIPLAEIVKLVFLFFFHLTSNYFFSLLLLSLASSFVMIKCMKFFQFLSERETLIQKILSPQIRKIKEENVGGERHHKIAALYKKYSYHPILVLRSAAPVFVQLPFLLAAYYMLSNFEALKGVSFFFIKDLSTPDALVYKINILPFLMTAINIATAFVSNKFSQREKIQAIVIALFFLFLLYNANSAMVIFWTMNNLILLLRTALSRFSKETVVQTKNNRDWSKYLIRLLKSPFTYPVLAGLYPTVFLYAHNFNQTLLSDVMPYFLISLFVTTSIICISKFVLKSRYKAGLFSLCGIVSLFYFGYFYSLFLYIKISGIYKVLIVWFVSILILLVILFSLRKKEALFVKIVIPLNIFSLLIFIISPLQMYVKFTASLLLKNDFNRDITNNSPVVFSSKNHSERPDIYYIILDGYTGNQALNKYYNFDNTPFIKYLEKKGFLVGRNARGNYALTFLALASSLNMDYLQNLAVLPHKNSMERWPLNKIMKNNKVVNYLKSKGYKFIHFQSGWGATQANKNADIDYVSSSYEFKALWLKNTVLYHFISRPFLKNVARSDMLTRFDKLAQVPSIKGPKFIFAHIMCPHPPFLFGQNGEEVQNSEVDFDGTIWTEKDNYINQLVFLNKKLMALVDSFLKDKSNQPVIIMQADHGAYYGAYYKNGETNLDHAELRSSILNTFYLPSRNYTGFHKTMSPVNTFRILFNSIFNENYKILKDEFYYSSYESPYKFKNYTEPLNNIK